MSIFDAKSNENTGASGTLNEIVNIIYRDSGYVDGAF